MKDTVPITARISNEAHEILVREAQSLAVNENSRLPVGEILSELLLYIEHEHADAWAAIADRVKCSREIRGEHRKFLDCDRKRRQKRKR